MRAPGKAADVCGPDRGVSTYLHRGIAVEGGVKPSFIVIALEYGEHSLEVDGISEQHVIENLAPDRTDDRSVVQEKRQHRHWRISVR